MILLQSLAMLQLISKQKAAKATLEQIVCKFTLILQNSILLRAIFSSTI